MLRQYVCFWGCFPMKMASFRGSYVAASLPFPYFLKTWSLASIPSSDKRFCEYCLLLIPKATGKFKFTFNDLPNWALSQGRKVSDCAHATLEEVAHLVCLRASLKSCCSLWKASWNACYPFERPLPLEQPWATWSPHLSHKLPPIVWHCILTQQAASTLEQMVLDSTTEDYWASLQVTTSRKRSGRSGCWRLPLSRWESASALPGHFNTSLVVNTILP